MKQIAALPLFAKVVELGSFAEAARQLGQPTTSVSRHIQQLEQELGGKLLNRSTRALSLTELGQQLLPKAQLIADTVNELQLDAEQSAHEPTGTLIISAPAATSQDLLVPLLAEFRRRYPKIHIQLASANRIADLTRQNIDFAFRLGPLTDSNLVAMPLSSVRYGVFAANSLLERLPKIASPRDLQGLPCIRAHVDGYLLPWQFVDDGEVVDCAGDTAVLVDDLMVVKGLVEQGSGLAYMPFSLFRDSPQVSPLQFTLPADRELLLVYQQRQHLPHKSRCFIDFIREQRPYFQQRLAP